MAIQVYLVKRTLKKRRRNGQHEHRWALRWEDADGWHCEATGTADRTEAESLQKSKWAALNIPGMAPAIEPAPAAVKATWQDCRNALQRAMEADNLRPSYVTEAVQGFDRLHRMFPELASPADMTADLANEFKRRRAEEKLSAWSIKSDLATLKAVFGKWLGRECGLLAVNPFAGIKAPRCDEPEIRIVAGDEFQALVDWLADRWNNWRLPLVYLNVAALLGWRATELASLRLEDLLADGHVRVTAVTNKTRRHKYGRLPPELYGELRACAADGCAFGRFPDELRRLLTLWHRQPHHAAVVKDFSPRRLVGWLQKELQRFHDDREAQAKKAGERIPERFTLHDFRRTAITGMQMAGMSEKETSVMVGATPEVMRKHYERMDAMTIAERGLERREAAGQTTIRFPDAPGFARPLRAADNQAVDAPRNSTQTVTA